MSVHGGIDFVKHEYFDKMYTMCYSSQSMVEPTKLKPLSDYILIDPVEKETTLPSGIVIPDTAKEKPQQGKVIAVGPGRRDDDGDRLPMDVKVGDIVMYKKWGGTEVKVDGREMLLVKEEDILATVGKK